MTVLHHPFDEALLSYSNGTLPFPLSLVVAGHLDGCRTCRQTVALAETLGGLFLDRTTPEELSQDALSEVSARMDMPVKDAPRQAPQNPTGLELPPALLRQRIGRRRRIAPGFWLRSIAKHRESGTRAYLLGAAAGKTIPMHGHRGVEMTLVIGGSFIDRGVRYGAGDFLQTEDFGPHSPVVSADGECVCAIGSQGVPAGWLGLLIRCFTLPEPHLSEPAT